jgi:hypothetical protein
MSEENVELVGRCVSSWIRGDFDPEEFLAEDIEWHAAPEEPEAGGQCFADARACTRP